MYICKEHGKLSSEWCGECGDIIKCDHSDSSWINGYIETKFGQSEVEVLCCDSCGHDIKARLAN